MIKPTSNPPVRLFTVADGVSTEDLLVNLSETLASAQSALRILRACLSTVRAGRWVSRIMQSELRVPAYRHLKIF